MVKKKKKKAKTSNKKVKKPAKDPKRANKAVKKARSKVSKKDDFVVGFEEVVIRCPCCNREFTMVKSSGFSTEGMLCQRCSAGGGTDFGDDE
ncbi:MAG: hypothetical protein U9O94_03690 [Nanoarchaeota archaeon]|nr:hypothetical protein [Nanoarchaeota archaeon]